MSTSVECNVCLEDVECSDLGKLKCSCGHSFCKSCLIGWFQMLETPRGVHYCHTPTCPTCREEINAWDIVRIMGRPLKRPAKEEVPPSPTEDELFAEWLMDQGAKQCPRCKIWVVRTDGCDHVICFCGAEFCYRCGGYCYNECSCWYEDDNSMCSYDTGYDDGYDVDNIDLQFFVDGAKQSFGGKKTLLWRGNYRTLRCGNAQRRKKKEIKRHNSKKRRNAQKKLLRSAMTKEF